MQLRVVVYAEGVGELAKESLSSPAPGTQLEPDRLGPVHVLAQRSITLVSRIPAPAIVFEHGLRTGGREPRGSDLHSDRNLRRLLEWPLAEMRPHLALVFVDEDDESARHLRLTNAIRDLHAARPPAVIAVARKEFEAWLVTDHACLVNELEHRIDDPGDPETWKPRRAKAWLGELLEKVRPTAQERFAVRRALCLNCDLEFLRSHSESFRRFLDDLEHAIP